jgi:hypothetical protein
MLIEACCVQAASNSPLRKGMASAPPCRTVTRSASPVARLRGPAVLLGEVQRGDQAAEAGRQQPGGYFL